MQQGIDVSSYQPTNYSTNALQFVFIKVTEGLSYVNAKWQAQRTTARAAGLVTGFYHYPHIANSPAAEADYFLNQITLAPGDILCLDWEWYGQTVTDQQARDYKDAFLARVKSKAPSHKVVLYSDVNNWTTVDQNSNCGDGLWIATAGRPAGQPGIQHPWVFHQYTDTPLDQDVANFATLADLKAWAGVTPPAPSPAPQPTPTPSETDMPQQITGPVTPGPQPTVVLPPAGSAWTAYPNRRLHLGMDEIGTPDAKGAVRVAIHNGTTWRTSTVTVTAAGGRVDVDMTSSDVKVSLQTDTPGVSFAVETW